MAIPNLFPERALYAIPLLIFVIKICDVSLNTIRIIFISRGYKLLAPVVAFVEILLWLFALTQVMQNLDQVVNFFAYAAGYAAGNFAGVILEGKIAIGVAVLRIITQKDASELLAYLDFMGVRTVKFDAEGDKDKKVKIIFATVKRQDLKRIIAMVKNFNPRAFYTIEDIRYVSRDVESSRKYVRKHYKA